MIFITHLISPHIHYTTTNALNIRIIYTYKDTDSAHSDDELTCFSYGIKYIRKDRTTQVHVFKTSADSCMLSDIANNRRKRSLNVVISIAEDIIRQVYHYPEEIAKIDISIRTDMDIDGFYCPDGWYVKNRPNTAIFMLVHVRRFSGIRRRMNQKIPYVNYINRPAFSFREGAGLIIYLSNLSRIGWINSSGFNPSAKRRLGISPLFRLARIEHSVHAAMILPAYIFAATARWEEAQQLFPQRGQSTAFAPVSDILTLETKGMATIINSPGLSLLSAGLSWKRYD